jgi:hypothetical protein
MENRNAKQEDNITMNIEKLGTQYFLVEGVGGGEQPGVSAAAEGL